MHDSSLPWEQARRVAGAAANPLAVVGVRLDGALDCVLAAPVSALTDLPPFPTAAMDGYAVSGSGPWVLADSETVLAGSESAVELAAGSAIAIATGAVIPKGAHAVLRREHAAVEGALHGSRLFTRDPLTGLPNDEGGYVADGTDVRPQGEECAVGDPLVSAGTVVNPAILGLAAAAGYDVVEVIPPPTVAVLILGDELLERGVPRPGRVRDALGPMVPPWLADLGARANPPIRVGDSHRSLLDEIEDSTADVIVTTGSTAAGPVDFVHDVLDHLNAHWLVDGVQVRPGHPMLLAILPDGRPFVGLPGNPLAAVSGLATLVAPLISAMRGVPVTTRTVRLAETASAHPTDTRLVPVMIRDAAAHPLRYDGPAMLRSLALAHALAVIPPGGGERDSEVEVLPIPGAAPSFR